MKLLSDEDKELIGEYKNMMVPVMVVVSSFLLSVVAFVVPITVAVVIIISAIKS